MYISMYCNDISISMSKLEHLIDTIPTQVSSKLNCPLSLQCMRHTGGILIDHNYLKSQCTGSVIIRDAIPMSLFRKK